MHLQKPCQSENNMPEISVLMSVYNGEKYLKAALDSILNQTFSDFEFIVVDDGSTDQTSGILDGCSDSRMVRLHNPYNIGLTRSLNRGLETVKSRYIARMDADDIAVPERLQEQIDFMEQHPEIGMLSGNIRLINPTGEVLNNDEPVYEKAASHEMLKWQLLWTNPVPHMTVMLRKDVLDKHHLTYVPEYNTAEDHELWATLAQHTRLVRLNRVWAFHRRIESSVSHSRREDQLATQYRVIAREIQKLLDDSIPESDIQTLFEILYREKNIHHNYSGAARIITAAYHLQKPASAKDQREMEGDAASYLHKTARRAGLHAPRQMLYSLWELRKISRREFASRTTLRTLRQIIQKSVLPG